VEGCLDDRGAKSLRTFDTALISGKRDEGVQSRRGYDIDGRRWSEAGMNFEEGCLRTSGRRQGK
jgi:hypothetical protein